jgi:hypothetical protein
LPVARPERTVAEVTGRHRLPEDWQPQRVEMLNHPGGAYALEWSAPTAAGSRQVRITRLEGDLEIFQAIIDEE